MRHDLRPQLTTQPVTYFENHGLILKVPRAAKWKTTSCNFHGGSDSMRVNVAIGAWVCISCGQKDGVVLAHEMKDGGREFVDAAKALGLLDRRLSSASANQTHAA